MNTLIKAQYGAQKDLSTFLRNYKKSVGQHSKVNYLKGRLDGLEEIWSRLRYNQNEIQQLYTDEHETLPYFKDQVYEKIEEKFYDLKGEILESIEGLSEKNVIQTPQLDNSVNTSNQSQFQLLQKQVKLPAINITKFTGDYHMWTSFHDLFNALIHTNDMLTSVQKLHYLKANLGGEAEQILRHYSITDANYEPAWQALKGRYANKRILVDAQLKLLINQQTITIESPQALKRLLDTTNESVHALKALGLQTETWDTIILYLITQKLPSESHNLWEQSLSNSIELPTLKQFQTFIENRFRTLEILATSSTRSKPVTPFKSTTKLAQTFYNNKGQSCRICRQPHVVRECPSFLKMDPKSRLEVSKSKSLCLNCLAQSHPTNQCKSLRTCFQCGKKHHTLLHMNNFSTNTTEVTSPLNHLSSGSNPESQAIDSQVNSYYSQDHPTSRMVLLATALVKVFNKNGDLITLRALIDQGSQASFITEAAAQLLQLKKKAIACSISGLSGKSPIHATNLIEATLTSAHEKNFIIKAELLVLRTLTKLLPSQRIPHTQTSWNHIKSLPLADPTFHLPGKIDMLIGADVYVDIIRPGIVKGHQGTPVGQQTAFGWILSGTLHTKPTLHKTRLIETFHNRVDLDQILRKFWEVEEVKTIRHYTEDEKRCEMIYANTTTRTNEGRYVVRLPFRDPSGTSKRLGKSRDIAIRRFLQLESKLKRNPILRQEYNKSMQEYIDLDHMEVVTTKEHTHQICEHGQQHYSCYYLPHHAVVKESSSTTKVRVVYDASTKSSTGFSLNDELLVGPTLQQELLTILIRWRTHKIALIGDIAKMYRQIWIHPIDANYQRIVWRFKEEEPIRDYNLKTVTFGTSAAPYLAIKTLLEHASIEAPQHPLAAKPGLNDFYVDDFMSGNDSIDEAQSLQSEIKNMLQSAGFHLRKWASNSTKVLQNTPLEEREIKGEVPIEVDQNIKALGINWHPDEDVFHFKLSLEPITTFTKRNLLSEISKLFDPLGWVAPSIIKAKVMMQQLWLTGLGWDEEIPTNLSKEWLTLRNAFDNLTCIRVPRWVSTNKKTTINELYGFSDASEQAYAASVYIRVITKTSIQTNLLLAKTRVAPLKQQSLPRLELCGAVLLARLLRKVKDALDLPISATHAFTDSTIVLAWIRKEPKTLKCFIANRVSEIQETLNPEQWHHISGSENPADIATRGLDPEHLAKFSLWWKGPQWLQESVIEHMLKPSTIIDTELERKKIKTFTINIANKSNNFIQRYSSLSKLQRVTAYCLRFTDNASIKGIKRRGWLTSTELERALLVVTKIAQLADFEEEITLLTFEKQIPKTSKLLTLYPFLDKTGLLRVGGRIHEATVTYDKRHPIILLGSNHLTKLVIDKAHRQTLHGGPQLMLWFIRQNYWIINARNLIRSHYHQCVTCFRQSPKPANQLMGNLPAYRINVTKPFNHVGLDYAGPIDIRASKGRGTRSYKGYIAVFVCLSTKAIHLEAVSDMTSEACLATFRRFAARRGLPQHVYSDCGSNFIGVSKKFKCENKIKHGEVAQNLANEGVNWHFIPPASPHFGGLWEAGVKSTKYHLRRIIGTTKLTFEEFNTLLCQIEACLNSRPLCPISSGLDDYEALTPWHFLIGTALLSSPDRDYTDQNINLLTRWQLVQRLVQTFWKQWSNEYLHHLQQRSRWTLTKPNLKLGDLVLIKDERISTCKWPLGRIIEVHPGKDGLVRVATIKTSNSTLKRPITKLCLLPIRDNVSENNIKSTPTMK